MTSSIFVLLVALSTGPQHGYRLMEQVRQLTNNEMQLGPGTLYRSLQRMQADGLVEEQEDESADSRRRTYQLTQAGRAAMHAELTRLNQLVTSAKHWLDNAGEPLS